MDYRRWLYIILVLYLLSVAFPIEAEDRRDVGLAQTSGYSITTGLEYESGNYGTANTTRLWRVPLSLDYLQGRFSAGISTAFLHAESNGGIIVGSMGRMSTVTHNSNVTSASGIGDVDLYTSYRLPTANEDVISYHLTGRIKIGSADANKGLGTGENDYALEGGLLSLLGQTYIFANLGYRVNGDSASVTYKDVWYLNAGSTYVLQSGRSLGAMLELSQASTSNFAAPAQLTLFLNQPLDKKRELYFYVLFGLSNGSPDNGIGANMAFNL